jgi:hypothetical protein
MSHYEYDTGICYLHEEGERRRAGFVAVAFTFRFFFFLVYTWVLKGIPYYEPVTRSLAYVVYTSAAKSAYNYPQTL